MYGSCLVTIGGQLGRCNTIQSKEEALSLSPNSSGHLAVLDENPFMSTHLSVRVASWRILRTVAFSRLFGVMALRQHRLSLHILPHPLRRSQRTDNLWSTMIAILSSLPTP